MFVKNIFSKGIASSALVQVPLETLELTYTCCKMKKKVKEGKMEKKHFDREVTKRVFGSVGSIGGSIAAVALGSAIGKFKAYKYKNCC